MQRTRKHLSFANVVSMIALFVALGGVSYAAINLPKNSVGTKQIKKNAVTGKKIKANAVTSAKVKPRSLLASDFKSGQVPAGPQGPRGANGADGTNGTNGINGTADAYARVQGDGTLELGVAPPLTTPQHKGIDQTDIQRAGVGIYCFGGLDKTVASAVVSMDNAGAAATTTEVASVAIQRGNNLGTCDADHQQARVVITDVSPALAAPAAVDGRFSIWFIY